MIEQLLANVERNRIKWRTDLSSDSLSTQRRIALQSVKDKLDEQAAKIQSESNDVQMQIQAAKRKEQQLSKLKDLLNKMREQPADALLKDCQVEFDKYLRAHAASSQKTRPSKDSKGAESSKDLEYREFAYKWAEYTRGSGAADSADDLRPMLGLDAYEAGPRPIALCTDSGGAMWRQRSKLLIDHEIGKIDLNRKVMRSFLHSQQGFLTRMRVGLY